MKFILNLLYRQRHSKSEREIKYRHFEEERGPVAQGRIRKNNETRSKRFAQKRETRSHVSENHFATSKFGSSRDHLEVGGIETEFRFVSIRLESRHVRGHKAASAFSHLPEQRSNVRTGNQELGRRAKGCQVPTEDRISRASSHLQRTRHVSGVVAQKCSRESSGNR